MELIKLSKELKVLKPKKEGDWKLIEEGGTYERIIKKIK